MTTTQYKNKSGNVINIKDIEKKYFDNWKIKDMAKYHQCSHQQITKIIWKEIPNRRNRIYKYKINHNYFDEVNTEKKAHLLGFLYADGCVSAKSNSLTISLQMRDIEIVKTIRHQLESDSPIEEYVYKSRPYCRIVFYSERICNELKKLGCIPNKSRLLKWNINVVPNKFLSHFIRGYFDGDGHFGFRFHKGKYLKSHFNITSTEDFCVGLSSYINSLFGYNFYMSKRHKESDTNNRTIELSGNIQIKTIMKWLYAGSTIFLKRKKIKFDEFLTIYESKLL